MFYFHTFSIHLSQMDVNRLPYMDPMSACIARLNRFCVSFSDTEICGDLGARTVRLGSICLRCLFWSFSGLLGRTLWAQIRAMLAPTWRIIPFYKSLITMVNWGKI